VKKEINIRAAREGDVPLIHQFIQRLAEYEKLSHEMVGSEGGLRDALFGAHPVAEVVLAEARGQAIGFALFFPTYSTFLSLPGLWLEDLFVLPEFRGAGAGTLLLAHLAALVVKRGWGRLEWAVLDWNADAIAFYGKLGAQAQDEWTTWRMSGDALKELSSRSLKENETP